MPEFITDSAGTWEVAGKRGRGRALVEPSAEWVAARKAESEAAETARIAAETAEKAGLEALSIPLVDRVEGLLRTRGLSAMGITEKQSVRDAAVYLSSRGKYGS